jgi:hypothetical protein
MILKDAAMTYLKAIPCNCLRVAPRTTTNEDFTDISEEPDALFRVDEVFDFLKMDVPFSSGKY